MATTDQIAQNFTAKIEILDSVPYGLAEPGEGAFYVRFALTLLGIEQATADEVVTERILELLDVIAPIILQNLGYLVLNVDSGYGIETNVGDSTGRLLGSYTRSRYIRVRNNLGLGAGERRTQLLNA